MVKMKTWLPGPKPGSLLIYEILPFPYDFATNLIRWSAILQPQRFPLVLRLAGRHLTATTVALKRAMPMSQVMLGIFVDSYGLDFWRFYEASCSVSHSSASGFSDSSLWYAI